MRLPTLIGTLLSLSGGGALAQASAAPANTLQELSAQLDHCLVGPEGAAGSQITVVFSLKRDGSVLERPRISFSTLPGTDAEKSTFVEGVVAAFDKCLPASITDELGGAIAGRLISMQFVVRARQTNT
jgi:hypothetical protein